ncbi:hypothetical protein CH300_10275 [Rhodococcus sp. 15-1154-1]|nr:hypothetical protein CH300_10275 [Rhodococcus sp. 15-1154-1]
MDGSESSMEAAAWAGREAAAHGWPVSLVGSTHEAASLMCAWVPGRRHHVLDYVVQQSLSAADAAAQEGAGARSLSVTRTVDTGSPPTVLVDAAIVARLLVIGCHGLGPLHPSVNRSVASHANCPVVVVRRCPEVGDAGFEGPVVVGIDGSRESERALARAFEESSTHGVSLVAVHTWTEFDLSTAILTDSDGQLLAVPQVDRAEHVVLSERLAGWRELYPDVPVVPVVVEGNPVQELLDRARTAQLLIVGRSTRRGRTILEGSVGRRLVHRAPCPVMIVPSS